MPGDDSKLNHAVTPVTSAPLNVLAMPEQISKSSRTWYAASYLINYFFVIPKDPSKPVGFELQNQQHTFTALPWGPR